MWDLNPNLFSNPLILPQISITNPSFPPSYVKLISKLKSTTLFFHLLFYFFYFYIFNLKKIQKSQKNKKKPRKKLMGKREKRRKSKEIKENICLIRANLSPPKLNSMTSTKFWADWSRRGPELPSWVEPPYWAEPVDIEKL